MVLGASTDSMASHEKFSSKYNLPFALLSDPEAQICTVYGVYKEKSMYGKKYMGVERSTFVIDRDGTLAFIYPKVKVEGHAEKVLADLGTLL